MHDFAVMFTNYESESTDPTHGIVFYDTDVLYS